MGDLESIARALCRQVGDAPECWQAYQDRAAIILADIKRLKAKADTHNPAISTETGDYIDICVGSIDNDNPADNCRADDYRVAGEVWRVHKGDADPFPSRPHAHCIAGTMRLIGCKLHLGTAQLYKGRSPLGRSLPPKQFERLIDLIRPKFPEVVLPLPVT